MLQIGPTVWGGRPELTGGGDGFVVDVVTSHEDVTAARYADAQEVVMVPVDALVPADSPRLQGVDDAHVRALLEAQTTLPPIVVHWPSMRVIDGMHRLRAAQIQGDTQVAAVYFSGDDAAAFVLAVAANITHGLPLSLADREAAANKIMRIYPHWSDRAAAKATGLSDKTIAALRRQASAEVPQLDRRMGQDGRVRPLNAAVGRRIASELVASRPEASLREIARAAGISPATVRDVRDRMLRGDEPVTAKQQDLDARHNGTRTDRALPYGRPRPARTDDACVDRGLTLDNLRRDPSLRYTDAGRNLLRWLDRHLIGRDDFTDLVGAIPPHCLPLIARLARQCAAEWKTLADELDQRMREIA